MSAYVGVSSSAASSGANASNHRHHLLLSPAPSVVNGNNNSSNSLQTLAQQHAQLLLLNNNNNNNNNNAPTASKRRRLTTHASQATPLCGAGSTPATDDDAEITLLLKSAIVRVCTDHLTKVASRQNNGFGSNNGQGAVIVDGIICISGSGQDVIVKVSEVTLQR